MYRYFLKVGNISYILSWKSKGLSDETIKPFTTSGNSLAPALSYCGTKKRVKFTGSCLKQDKITYTHGKTVNIYIVFELSLSNPGVNYPTLTNSLFGAVKLTKNVDIDKYKYFGYDIGFDRRWNVSFTSGGFGSNVITFGVDVSSSTKIDNRKKDALILGDGPAEGLEHALIAKKKNVFN